MLSCSNRMCWFIANDTSQFSQRCKVISRVYITPTGQEDSEFTLFMPQKTVSISCQAEGETLNFFRDWEDECLHIMLTAFESCVTFTAQVASSVIILGIKPLPYVVSLHMFQTTSHSAPNCTVSTFFFLFLSVHS